MPLSCCFVPGLLALALLATPAAADEAPAGPTITVGKGQADFKVGGQLVARYVTDQKAAKPYFWPLYALPGKAVTRPWPMEEGKGEARDHMHQKSAWFCHGDVIPEGLDYKKHIRGVTGIDFWSEAKGHGRIVCVSVRGGDAGPRQATLLTRNEWRTAEGQKVLEEQRDIRLVPLDKNRTLLVLDITLLASECPVTFGDTKEGSLGVRVRESLRADRGKSKLTNAEGKSGEGLAGNQLKNGCWGVVSAWCDYSGPVDEAGTVAGISVFADPANKIDTAWHARNYGLMAANPFGRKAAGFPSRRDRADLVCLGKGEALKLRYGIYLHAGDVKEGRVAEAFGQFSMSGR